MNESVRVVRLGHETRLSQVLFVVLQDTVMDPCLGKTNKYTDICPKLYIMSLSVRLALLFFCSFFYFGEYIPTAYSKDWNSVLF